MGYCCLMLASALCSLVAMNAYFFRCQRLGQRLRSVITTAVYEKSLRLSLQVRTISSSSSLFALN